jgi:exopolysaccharide biosynthesis polyprenyl glycosylphosphotransferase
VAEGKKARPAGGKAPAGGDDLFPRGDSTVELPRTVRRSAGSGSGSSPLAEAARRNKDAELARAAELAAEAAASGVDEDAVFDSTSVRPLRQLRPVPPLARAAARDLVKPVPSLRPVYDPLSARRRRAPAWLVRYTGSLVVADVAAAAAAGGTALAVSGATTAAVATALSLVAGWPAVVAMSGGYAERRLGAGTDEFRRVLLAGLLAVAVLSTSAVAFAQPDLRSFVLLGAPAATFLALMARLVLRHRLHAARRRGAMTKQVVVVGREIAVLDLVRRLRRDPDAGLRVVGACVPNPRSAGLLAGEDVPVLAGMADAVEALERTRADAVVVASASETAGQYLRDLSWRLEGTNIEILVAPGLVEVSPDRLQVRPTTSFPLLHVREPEFRGVRRLVKSVFDRSMAALALLFLGPVLLGLAVAVRLSGPGPVLYRQERVGVNGRMFTILKFRSMVVDAEKRLEDIRDASISDGLLFKMRDDPRVTPVGRWMRRLSLDELPQLFNVLGGTMSLVGPRPPLPSEVARYDSQVQRRLLVKPGLTGLWQISGRSDLPWEEAVRLDLRYVENWSLSLDLRIMWRTGRAVLRSSGAY